MRRFVQESSDRLTITVQKPTLRYIDELLSTKCGLDLSTLRVFPNAKEVTESFAAFRAVRKNIAGRYYGFGLWAPWVKVYVVGDGNTPRTAAVFAFRSMWTVTSIDPRLTNPGDWENSIKRLQVFTKTVEDYHRLGDGPTILICVHSHANLEVANERIRPDFIVAIPCCVPQTIASREPDIVYDDYGIFSPERTVRIWNMTNLLPYYQKEAYGNLIA